jgi:hypothetical protein
MEPKPAPKNYHLQIAPVFFMPENPLEFSPREESGLADVEIERTGEFFRLRFTTLDGNYHQVRFLINEEKYLYAFKSRINGSENGERFSTKPESDRDWLTDRISYVLRNDYKVKSGGNPGGKIEPEIINDLDTILHYLYKLS